MEKKEKKSRKDKKANLDDFDMEKELAEVEESAKVEKAAPPPTAKPNDDDAEDTESKPKAVQGKKGKKGRKQVDDDFDMEKELAEAEAEAAVAKKVEPKTQPKVDSTNIPDEDADSKQKGKKGKKGGKKQVDDDFDMEKELAELDKAPVEETPSATKSKKPPAKEKPVEKEKTAAVKEKKETEIAAPKIAEKPSEEKSKEADKKKPVNKAKEQMKEHLRRIQEEKDKFERQELEKIRLEEEAEQKRLDDIQKEKDRKEKEKQKKKDRKERLKAEGKLLTAKEKQSQARAQAMIESLRAQGITVGGEKPARKERAPKKLETQNSEEKVEKKIEEESSSSSAESELDDWDKMADKEIENQEPELLVHPPAVASSSSMDLLPTAQKISTQKLGHLRSAVVCVLGHVDTGKTKILDKIRSTNVQDMEAGGITQQIGATMVPNYAIQSQSAMVQGFAAKELKLPGLLIIDTPGHESFSNLRSRGSSLCDIAILVVDIMHGLEPQTIESLNMLKSRKTPFVVALNKVDRLFEWKSMPKIDVRDAIGAQLQNVKLEFKDRCQKIVTEFAEQGLNAALFYENADVKNFISMVPTSAHTGDGMGNLMAFIVDLCQTVLARRLTFTEKLECTVLEVKELTGLGTTVDVILTNGSLSEGDTVVLAGFEGPICTQVRGLLMPQPLRELRVKNAYEKHKTVHGAQGVKILAKDLETCLAGLPLYVAHTPEEQEHFKKEIADQLESALKSIQRSERGVYVQASTLGSLEALLEFLRTSKIPYCGINIGPVHKKDVRTASAMLEQDPTHAVILAFDVKIEREAQTLADELGVRIFSENIIYHLFDRFTQYQDELKAKRREENKHLAIFPCKLKIIPEFIFNTRDPIIVGVKIEAGVLKIGTPLCVPTKDFVDIGIVTSIEYNHKAMDLAKKGQDVCIKIEPEPGSTPKLLGRHFENEDVMVSKISRPSIDVCKEYFREDLAKADWQLMVELKNLLKVF